MPHDGTCLPVIAPTDQRLRGSVSKEGCGEKHRSETCNVHKLILSTMTVEYMYVGVSLHHLANRATENQCFFLQAALCCQRHLTNWKLHTEIVSYDICPVLALAVQQFLYTVIIWKFQFQGIKLLVTKFGHKTHKYNLYIQNPSSSAVSKFGFYFCVFSI